MRPDLWLVFQGRGAIQIVHAELWTPLWKTMVGSVCGAPEKLESGGCQKFGQANIVSKQSLATQLLRLSGQIGLQTQAQRGCGVLGPRQCSLRR